eukprot:CAMPEP_0176500066 /NCGR_PEP_ID=MMETSP0200_2-20121128/13307_1 /TAXON_ID=947934 /ORGANISM="Chaetoceros sp., Strain GSL56" /LENGTH=744 /DNA_ID=CAMNT_0017898617 /DNA_START=86 /DNA_END=2317 /DNA_ORIENTATION=-
MSHTFRIAMQYLALFLCLHIPSRCFSLLHSSHYSHTTRTRDIIKGHRTSNIIARLASQQQESIPNVVTNPQKQHSCQFCSQSFSSRNQLFRHVRNSVDCATKANGGKEVSQYCLKRIDIVLHIAYECYIDKEFQVERLEKYDSVVIGKIIKHAFLKGLNELYHGQIGMSSSNNSNRDDDLTPKILSSTQTSVASQRHYSLSQENGVSSVGEVMTLSYVYPVRKTLLDEKKEYRQKEEMKSLEEHRLVVQQQLENNINMEDWKNDLGTSVLKDIQLLSAKILSENTKIHAEMSCTQRAYHYILPLRWLNGGREIEKWWLENRNNVIQSEDNNDILYGIGGEMRAKKPPPNDTLQRLKFALRSAECKRIAQDGSENLNLASGRYGVLALKERKPWHNFANPNLKGDASPNNKPVWKVIDRCRIVQFVCHETIEDTQAMAIIEFRGDDFLAEQIRRIIGSVVAICNEWLPDDFIQNATQMDMFIKTPAGPMNHMYFAEARFHFNELVDGQRLFEETDIPNTNTLRAMVDIQNKIMARICSPTTNYLESLWLASLQKNVAPKIRNELKSLFTASSSLSASSVLTETPIIYSECLSMLRDVVSAGRWPTTSSARSKVIKNNPNKGNNATIIDSGSFTVINPKFNDGLLMNDDRIKIPLGNQLFPDLVSSIFDLEEELSKDPNSEGYQRPSSSHCAVNRNAQFTPHVDSGRGSGQSLSMIVGLGDYTGGELLIEGESSNIRYNPIQFDGW